MKKRICASAVLLSVFSLAALAPVQFAQAGYGDWHNQRHSQDRHHERYTSEYRIHKAPSHYSHQERYYYGRKPFHKHHHKDFHHKPRHVLWPEGSGTYLIIRD